MGAVITWIDPLLGFQTLRFHAVESETLTDATETSDHAIEQGADVTDHVRDMLKTASIQAFVTNRPTRGGSLTKEGFVDGNTLPLTLSLPQPPPSFLAGGIVATIGRALAPPPTSVTVPALQFFTEKNFFEEVLKVLTALKKNRQFVECMTTPWSLSNALITSITPSRDGETGYGGRVTIDFKEVRRVKLRQAQSAVPSVPKAKKKVVQGAQSTKPAEAAKEQSIAVYLADNIKKFLGP